MWVMAIRSGLDWEFDPGPEDVVTVGDVLLIRGPEEGVNLRARARRRAADAHRTR